MAKKKHLKSTRNGSKKVKHRDEYFYKKLKSSYIFLIAGKQQYFIHIVKQSPNNIKRTENEYFQQKTIWDDTTCKQKCKWIRKLKY